MLIIIFVCLISCALTSYLPSFVPLVAEDRFAKFFLKPVEVNLDGQNKCDLEPIAFVLPCTPSGPAILICKGVALPLPPNSPNLVLTVNQQGMPVAVEPSCCLPPLQSIDRPIGSILIYFRYASTSRLINYYRPERITASFDIIEQVAFPAVQFVSFGGAEVVSSLIIEPQPLPANFTLPPAYPSYPLQPFYTSIARDVSASKSVVRVLGKEIELTNALMHNDGSGTCLLLTMDVMLLHGSFVHGDYHARIGLYVIDKQDALPHNTSFGSHFNVLYQFNVINGN